MMTMMHAVLNTYVELHANAYLTTVGSMPPHSTSLSQEGAAIVSFKLVENGVFQEEGITRLLMQPAGLLLW